MQIIKTLQEKINEELHDACSYAKLALEHKDMHKSVADMFYSLSQDEMRHSMILHEKVVEIIHDYREENGEPPKEMLAVYNYLHERAIEKAEKVKRYQALYKD